jgi:hypothetical protein
MADSPSTDVRETSSHPMPMPGEQEELFHRVLSLFEERQIPYAVAGAFALQAHTGICRDTKDLDLFLTSETATTALNDLRASGFCCEVCDPVWLYKVHRDGFFVDLITGMSNAALVVDDSWIDRARPAVVLGVPSRVLAAEEVLLSKLFVTHRERFDGADIAHVVYGTAGKLDWPRLLSSVGEHWEIFFWALILFRYAYPAQTQFVPQSVWNELTTRFQDTVSNPDPEAKFRGSLIDDKMFAIDVKEWGLDNLLADFRKRRLQSVLLNS